LEEKAKIEEAKKKEALAAKVSKMNEYSMKVECKFYKYDKIKDINSVVSEKATLFLTDKGFVVTEKEAPLLQTIFEPHTIVSFKWEDGVVMWLHSEQGNLDAYLAVL